MIRNLYGRLLALLMFPGLAAAGDETWTFRVLLGDREIGQHEFILQREGAMAKLHSEANFEYRILFAKLYEYQHENSEIWDGDCLRWIESRTDANGRAYHVTGTHEGERFLVDDGSGEKALPACVMTFAYWNPALLNQTRLLNAQNGELIDVQVSEPQADHLVVRGDRRAATRYRLTARDFDIYLWYSEDRQWLALETEARGGRRLRYELL